MIPPGPPRSAHEPVSQFLTSEIRSEEQVKAVESTEKRWSKAGSKRMTRAEAGSKLTLEGRLLLYTERVVCPSCQAVIESFRLKWPTIWVDVAGG